MAWNIDPSHSQAEFSVRHLMISNVRGRFEEMSGEVEFDENDLSKLKVDVKIDAASIDTRDAQRDGHLRSPDFLDVENHPYLHFRSTGVEKVDGERLVLAGDLTIRDVTRPVKLEVEYAGTARSPWGTTSAGFSASTKINRKDFGLVWNQALETGGVLVGDDVKIDIEIELVKQEVPAEEEAVTA